MNAKIICILITSFLFLANIVMPLQAMNIKIPIDIPTSYTLFLKMGGLIPQAPSLTPIHCDSYTIIRKSGADYMQYNQIYTIQDNLNLWQIEEVRRHMNKTLYGWWVPTDYNNVAAMLEKNDFAVVDKELIMVLDLYKFSVDNLRNTCNQKLEEELPMLCNQKIQFEKAITDDELDLWIIVSAQGLELDINIHDTFVQFIRKNAGEGSCSFYIGYLDNLAVSTCLIIKQEKKVGFFAKEYASIHFLSTVPAYQGRMFDNFLSLFAIEEAKAAGCTHVTLMCSEKVRSFFSSLGFEHYQAFNVYQDKNPAIPQDDHKQDSNDSQDMSIESDSKDDDSNESNSFGFTSCVSPYFDNCVLF